MSGAVALGKCVELVSLCWQVMMDDSAPTSERRNLLKPTKNVLPQKQTMTVEKCGGNLFKKKRKKERKRERGKTITEINNSPKQVKKGLLLLYMFAKS